MDLYARLCVCTVRECGRRSLCIRICVCTCKHAFDACMHGLHAMYFTHVFKTIFSVCRNTRRRCSRSNLGKLVSLFPDTSNASNCPSCQAPAKMSVSHTGEGAAEVG